VARVKDVLLELGKGFAFVGSQQHLGIGGQCPAVGDIRMMRTGIEELNDLYPALGELEFSLDETGYV
jgi:hypothetical protein